MISANLAAIFYLVSGILFILALEDYHHQIHLDKETSSELSE